MDKLIAAPLLRLDGWGLMKFYITKDSMHS